MRSIQRFSGRLALAIGLLAGAARDGRGDEAPPTFDAVRTTFQARCLRCHGADEPKAGLDLRTRDSALAGGELGPVIEPGSIEGSLLWDMVAQGDMPPVGPPLTDEQKGAIRDWIAAGAPTGSGRDRADHFGPLALEPIAPAALDAMIDDRLAEVPGLPVAGLATDEHFLRRASFDLIGRQPTPDELAAFLADESPDKRSRAIDGMLGRPEFGTAQAAYWSDAISYRVPPPELTFLRYDEFEAWLADRLNAGEPWDRVVRALLTAEGKVADDPATTFVAFHQGDPVKLSSETSRLFLGLQLQCAQCHDHKFDHWKREQFHGMAAFFGRAEAKLSQNDPGPTVVKAKGEGEYAMPNLEDPREEGTVMAPTFLDGRGLDAGATDAERRAFLAEAVTDPSNPWFARAYVNRVWARLTGRGFFEPVDNMAAYQRHDWPEVHDALAGHFAYTGFDVKGLFRLVMSTSYYQRALPERPGDAPLPYGAARPRKLNGDEVYDALARAVGLPNVTPPEVEPTKAVRFPPPPESTRDLVADRFGFDPSLCPDEVARTMSQAMRMMNNEQIQARIDADPSSETPLARLLLEEPDDERAVDRLYRRVLARRPTDRERAIALDHVESVGDRREAFEDLLWSLLNSAEFTTRR